MEILRQLGELFLQATPTVIILCLFYFFLRANFFAPLDRVLAERRARTEGARREAESSQAAAQERLHTYREELQRARAEIYAEQESARRAALEERLARIREARSHAGDRVRAAKEALASDLERARAELEPASQMLAAEIARAILQGRSPGARRPSESR